MMKNKFFLKKRQEIEMNVIKLQRSLDEKKRDYNEIVSSIPGGICKIFCDDDLTILYANEFFYKMFGYTEEEAKEKGFQNVKFVTYDLDFEKIKEQLKDSSKKHTDKVEIEVRQIHKNGQVLWVLARCIHNEKTPGGFTCVLIDITSRKSIEEELKIREEEYRIAIQQHTDKIIVRYDLLNKTLVRPQWASEVLKIPQVMQNVPYSMVEDGYILPESADEYIDFYESMLKGTPQGNCVFNLYNGRWYRADYTLVYNENKKPIRSIVSYEDVTEQREKAIAYEKWRQYNSSLLEKSIAYYEYNLTKDLVDRIDTTLSAKLPDDVSKSFSALVHYVAEHFIYELDKEKYRGFFSREMLLSRYYMGKRELIFEYRRINSFGNPYWVSTTIQLLPDPYSDDIKLFVLLQNIDEQKQEEDRLQKLSQTDPLTGLLNRRMIIDKVDEILKNREDSQQYAFIMIDIDHFKELNDTLGHLFGDQVLIDIGKTIQQSLQEEDLMARLGGDEFVVFLQYNLSILYLEQKVQEICKSLVKSFEQGIVISGSLGVALAPRDGKTFTELYQKADTALYKAKKYGRNQYVFYKNEMVSSKFSLSEIATKELLKKEALEWDLLEKRIFAYYHIAFCSLYDELFEFNLTKNEYQMIYHLPNQYNIPKEKGNLIDLITNIAEEVIYSKDKEKFIKFFNLTELKKNLHHDKITFEEEFRTCKTNGEYKWIALFLIPFITQNGDDIVLCCTKDIDDKKKAEKKVLKNYQDQDRLTGFLSFERFRIECDHLLKNRGNKKYALWYCDLRNFKFLNDIYGYEFGDRILQYWAKIIDEGMGEGETFARKSADHFMMLRQYENIDELEQRFNRSVNLLKNYKEFSAKKFQVDMVAGIYLIEKEEDILFMEDMIDRSNMAKQKAKSQRGSKFAVYTESMRKKIIYEKEIEADMHRALGIKEFCVYLQPQVDIHHENKIIGAEALVRWKKNDGSIIPPADFIPLFEKNGFIVKLDRFVFEEVCRYLQQRLIERKNIFKISVNVSRISALQNDFVESYIKIKNRYEIPNDLLEIEFTETVIVENVEHLDNVMKQMRDNGFIFSLDDFGSGYSSLNMLKNVVVDVIKLDMMFFKNSVDIKREEIIVGSLIYMAKALDMKIIAEGVETKEQLVRLKKLGCDIVQGYYFGKPVAKEEFEVTYKGLF